MVMLYNTLNNLGKMEFWTANTCLFDNIKTRLLYHNIKIDIYDIFLCHFAVPTERYSLDKHINKKNEFTNQIT